MNKKDAEIECLKSELPKNHKTYNTSGCNFDTLTTHNNDPLALRQEVQDLNIMIDEIELERDNAQNYIKKLESELQKTKEVSF
jgi:hypothetical protein